MTKTFKFLAALSAVVLGTALTSPAQAEANNDGSQMFKPFGEGLPLPWPFPWAKDCPMKWEHLTGRYSLEDSSLQEQIDLKISVIRRSGFRWIRVARYDSHGEKISDGQVLVRRNQKSIRVRLRAVDSRERFLWASLRLHYPDNHHLCTEKKLVPILTLEAQQQNVMVQTQYRLVRM